MVLRTAHQPCAICLIWDFIEAAYQDYSLDWQRDDVMYRVFSAIQCYLVYSNQVIYTNRMAKKIPLSFTLEGLRVTNRN